MKKYIPVFVLMILVFLFSRNQWSNPIMLSDQGVYPDSIYAAPAVVVDKKGVIHAFWAKGLESEFNWKSIIEYRKSEDGGFTWSPTENITPEYTNDAEGRIFNLKAVCDSKNNIHLIYTRTVIGTVYDNILHKKFNGEEWEEPVIAYPYFTDAFHVGIDNSDRIFVTWYLGPNESGTTYYIYYDNNTWHIENAIHPSIRYVIRDFKFDDENNIHAAGFSKDDVKPYYFKYDRSKELWTVYEEIYYEGTANSIVLTNSDSIVVSIGVGPTIFENTNYIFKKDIVKEPWNIKLPELNTNTYTREKYFYTDKYDNLHLMEMHINDVGELLYTYQQNGDWKNEIFQAEPEYSFDYLNVSFNGVDSLYIIYKKHHRPTNDTAIYFQSRELDSGINDNEQFTIVNYELKQNYPNPFNSSTEISFSIKDKSNVGLTVFNSKGELVKELANNVVNAGMHTFMFNASNINSGIYYYRLAINGEVKETKKMLYLR